MEPTTLGESPFDKEDDVVIDTTGFILSSRPAAATVDDKDHEDTALILSLGANIVDREQFESNLVEQLEQRLQEQNQARTGQQNDDDDMEEGQLSDEDDDNSNPLLLRQQEEDNNTSTSSSKLADDTDDQNKKKKSGSSEPSSTISKKGRHKKTIVPPQGEEEEETEHEKRVRCGQVTPFGTELEEVRKVPTTRDSFLNFNKYLQDQLHQQQRKKSDNAPSTSASDKSKKKKKLKKDPLNMNILFPKNRKKKEQLGLNVSENPRDTRKRPGKSLAESTSTYLNASDDSEYLPSDLEDSGGSDYEKAGSSKTARSAPVRKRKSVKKSLKDKESEDEDSSDYDSDYDRPSKRLRRETDDGDYKYYQQRVQQWKEQETRFTGEFKTFDGGFKIPLHLYDSLYTYQKVGVKWLWELHQQRSGGILGDEMGLGKTIQVICFLIGISCSNTLFRMSSYRGLGPVLLITPATVMHQWVSEFHIWWPMFRVAILHQSGSFAGSKAGLIRSINEGRGILITSYNGLVNNQNTILQYDWHYMILDEGHKIRNPDAQVTLVAKQVKTPHRFILSGSPLQNNLKELWSLFDFVYPGKLGELPTFMEQFAVPITQGGYANATQIQVAIAYKCAKALRDLINPYLLRRMKSDVKDHINLPEKNEQVLFCKMTNAQRELYKSYIDSKEIVSILKGSFNMFVGLINLRKICNHPHLFDGGPKEITLNPYYTKNIPKTKSGLVTTTNAKLASTGLIDIEDEGEDIEINPKDDTFGHWSKSGKMVVVETLLKLWHKQGHKVLLFTQSRQMLCILENFVRQYKYKYLRLDGSTSISSRQPMINKFNTDPDIFIFILTTRVGGLGVNLTAANRVLLYDPDWNPSTDMQARERAWRIGQLREVTIYRLILSGTIEEKMYHRQVFKQFLTNRVLKDPKQKRFFKSNDMVELFTFNEGTKGTESQAIFAGTGSNIKVKKSTRNNKNKEPREKSSGKLKDVPNLVKQRPAKQPTEEQSETNNNNKKSNNSSNSATGGDSSSSKTNAEQDEYVLQKLFKNSNVHAALRHDKIVDTNEADYMIVEKEAESVAKKAVETLKRSREMCWDAESGRANWTGQQGEIRKDPPPQPKLRFGKKKSSATVTSSSLLPATQNKDVVVEEDEESLTPDKYFSGHSLLQEALTNKKKSSFSINATANNNVMSSADLLAIIRNRKSSLPIPESGDDATNQDSSSVGGGPDLKPEQIELLRDIREFIAFQAMVDGQATTDELLKKFGPRLPSGQSPLFKEMLNQICTFRKVEGRGMWRLKPEFR